ncbi:MULTISPECIES: ABC transporter permease [Enterococcus]|uniref:Transport permease protein n=1 Tax=Enterococcus thailandicus TaxID=417368 RepID=A0A179ESA6_ENTTH|nr:ABC transporter permease [Enterococcus thailandicus]MDT2795114.1 ABC transporter permease [Enterococcus thailandicus]OAQ55942.1 Teichoic acid translocation permease TagG [Enterococcus thailandicus]GEK37483.1 transport permease protein [Enterococcus thailandicus]GMC02093.1 transport permease protein [Enterococcus thailandicus]
MNEVAIIIKEQLSNLGIIFRMSKYEEKATYQNNYLGLLWQILNPLIQVGIYYMVFGLGVHGGRTINGVPYIIWMIIGISAWFFISPSIMQASNSIYKQVGLVSKMKFPVSVLPSISIAGQLTNYFWYMMIVITALLLNGVYPTLYWLQYIYYFFSMLVFLYAFGIFNATITTLVRDYHVMLQSIFRLLFYISGAIWNFQTRNLPEGLVKILEINPLYYLIDGFRDSFLSREWFWNKGTYGLIFWSTTLLLLLIGSHIHLKFRAKFVDYI